MEFNSLTNAFVRFNIYFFSSFYSFVISHVTPLKLLPELDFQRVAVRSSMDPFPSKTSITGENNFKKTPKNNHLKSPEIKPIAYSKWRRFIQKNEASLEDQRVPPLPGDGLRKQGYHTQKSRPLVSATSSRALAQRFA